MLTGACKRPKQSPWCGPTLSSTQSTQWIWICFFLLALQSSISANTIYYAYADFESALQASCSSWRSSCPHFGRYLATSHFLRWELVKNANAVGACCLAAIIVFNYYTWDTYFYYYVEMVDDLDTAYTGYMTQTYTVGYSLCSV
ncbi:hypothetical protein ASPZODRAFT_131175 [Penicilliopsis zonata CBS 506.65]|uniref:Uncharacterized protein n=1 Tax=Penicilliopsis zonata CBS 506.65 TaxID=1073090 RepID=A0A1L9SK65_9EURO|nr:hypothetical protein ASPZODRAFT_131175 [Penicilliopsis zonata CBS 506.65]OJJ47629.1 hypothetical protein ASPZODRAFT_131175 [Penicilliopsis zonata CBS 506.65]